MKQLRVFSMSSVDLLCCTLGGVILLTLAMTTSQHRATPASVRGNWLTFDGEVSLATSEDVRVGVEVLRFMPPDHEEHQFTRLGDSADGEHPAIEALAARVTPVPGAQGHRAFRVSVQGVGATPGVYRFRVFVSGATTPLDETETTARFSLARSGAPTTTVAEDVLRLRRSADGLRLLEPYWCVSETGSETALPSIAIVTSDHVRESDK